ncbi:hypothetical protein AVT69_gp316 [Pseudomonas phage PhiPA3]|uniref:Uncharacterized protein 318 n=1 Tax=Pseudomonas phage PhiPA3 TaxID=998086 RepID=F8SJF4_BPPA3|nr:hypothetical protein AVT69_gp316 [Pseudomonas phage PhiPA3]AEH03741.1 hypothetical protein [Pseudomonas phage PhiPA3]
MQLLRSIEITRTTHGYPEVAQLDIYLDWMNTVPVYAVHTPHAMDSEREVRLHARYFVSRPHVREFVEEYSKCFGLGAESIEIDKGYCWAELHQLMFLQDIDAPNPWRVRITNHAELFSGIHRYVGIDLSNQAPTVTYEQHQAAKFHSQALASVIAMTYTSAACKPVFNSLLEELDNELIFIVERYDDVDGSWKEFCAPDFVSRQPVIQYNDSIGL